MRMGRARNLRRSTKHEFPHGGWACIGELLAVPAGRRSAVGGKDACRRLRIQRRGQSRSCRRNSTRHRHSKRGETLRQRSWPKENAAAAQFNERPIAPGNGWCPLPPWDPAFPGAFFCAFGVHSQLLVKKGVTRLRIAQTELRQLFSQRHAVQAESACGGGALAMVLRQHGL